MHDEGGSEGVAAIIFEDAARMRDTWRNVIAGLAPEVYVLVAQDLAEGMAALDRAEKLGYRIVLALVDQVMGEEKRAGTEFLRELKRRAPMATRMMISGKATRDDIQTLLEEGLVHDFETKVSFDRGQPPERIKEKIRAAIVGRPIGNVRASGEEERFRQLMQKWIESLPDGEDTRLENLYGTCVRAGDIFEMPQLLQRLRQAYMTSTLDLAVKEGGGGDGGG